MPTNRNEIITFNAAGSINVSGATMDVDGAFTATTVTSDGAVGGTTITAGTSIIAPLFDAAGDEDMDYGSADVDDHTFTSDGGTVILDGSVTASAGVNLGTSQALVGTTGLTVGDNSQTVAIDSSDWDIDATGAMTGIGNITSNGSIIIGDAGNIGSASDTDAIAIASDGVVTFSQDVVLAADSIITADIATDAVTMDAIDADGDFTSLTGNWATTGVVTAGTLRSGVSATTAGNLTMYDAATIVMGDDGDNTSVTIGPVADGTTTLGLTGSLLASGTIGGMIAVTQATEERVLTTAEVSGGLVEVSFAGEVRLPDVCDSASGAMVMITQKDDSETVEIAVTDTSDHLWLDGTDLGANYEIDSPGNAEQSNYIVLVCTEANNWKSFGRSGTWVTGGAAD